MPLLRRTPFCQLLRRNYNWQMVAKSTFSGIWPPWQRCIQGFLELSVATQASPHRAPLEFRKPAFSHGIPGWCGSLEKPRTGTFVTSSEPELSTSGYNIAVDRQVSDLGWPLAGPLCFHELWISTRLYDSSPYWSTQMVQEKVHAVAAVPLTQKLWYRPCLSRSLFRFSGLVSECPISTIYCTEFHHLLLPTPTQLHLSIISTVVCLQNSLAHILESAISKHPCRIRPLNG